MFEQKSEEQKAKFIQCGMDVAIDMAQSYISSIADFDELFSEAVTALHEAVSDYNGPVDGFTQYLEERIKCRLDKCYEQLQGFLPIDRKIAQLHDRYEKALLELCPIYRGAEDESEMAEYLGVTVDELRNMKSEYDMCMIRSLDEPVYMFDDDEATLLDTIVDPTTDDAAAKYLDELMDGLTETERYIVCAKNGVLSVMERTDKQIAQELGIPTHEVNLMYIKAIDKIKQAR